MNVNADRQTPCRKKNRMFINQLHCLGMNKYRDAKFLGSCGYFLKKKGENGVIRSNIKIRLNK